MKKIFIMAVGAAVLLSSCSSAGSGAMTGSMFGGIIGSCIGGIGGGPRGSDIGTLVGMAVGAGAGAAIGAAAEKQERAQFEAHRDAIYQGREYPVRDNDVNGTRKTPDADTGYSADPVYDDVITMGDDSTASESADVVAEVQSAPILISNARFINDAGTTHIAKGELVKISFEIRNVSEQGVANIVPYIQETTGNSHLIISPSTLIERLPSRRALRYTAYVSAETSLRRGTAHFVLSVISGDKTISNVIEFDVPLN